MKYDFDIHSRRSIRLREYDYSSAGAYFVTICAQERECLFGELVDGVMRLNPVGEKVRTVWDMLPERFPDITMDEFVVMPNHFHGIIMLNKPDNDVDRRGEPCVRPTLNVEHENQGEHKVRPYGTAAGSVGQIVQAFKSMTTNAYIHGVNEHGWLPFPGRLWQRNYYERVIRDERELDTARKYIEENPIKWHLDRENPINAPVT